MKLRENPSFSGSGFSVKAPEATRPSCLENQGQVSSISMNPVNFEPN